MAFELRENSIIPASRRRPLLILPSGQGRSSPARSKSFHRARPTLTSDGCSECGTANRPPRAKVGFYQPIYSHMGYLEQFEAELGQKLNAEDDAITIRWASEKLLESYRNGIKAGQKGERVLRSGKSRRPFVGQQTQ